MPGNQNNRGQGRGGVQGRGGLQARGGANGVQARGGANGVQARGGANGVQARGGRGGGVQALGGRGGGVQARGGRGGKGNDSDEKPRVVIRGGGGANSLRVARPAVTQLPESLMLSGSPTLFPSVIRETLTEFKKPQPYFSALEKLQPSLESSQLAPDSWWLGISGEALASIERESDSTFEGTLKLKDGTSRSIFIKRIHIVDPFAVMEGECTLPDDGALPAPSELWASTLDKINEPLNEAYVDALFALYASKLVESRISPHWCLCYGTFTARVDKYLYNISDEYDSLRHKPWWKPNQRAGIFKYHKEDTAKKIHTIFTESGQDLPMDDFTNLDDVVVSTPVSSTVSDTLQEVEPMDVGDEPVQLTQPRLRLKRLPANDGDESSGTRGSYGNDDDEIEEFVEFKNFPVQVSLLEKANGTMDTLLDEEDDDNPTMRETKDTRWSAWLFQIIAGLVVAQHYFGFVHNDLHTNNIMWNGTDITHIYYRVIKGKDTWYMKIPTYGRLMKIIDFGRASFTLPNAGFFISDAFFPGNDAATQYNCDPFFDKAEGKRVEPNTSFDLCRLAVSLLESLFSERPENVKPVRIMSREGAKLYPETTSSVYNLLWEWLTDDNGKNVLRTPKGEERYPDFDLYRALAADVHNAMPKTQIEKPIFAPFRCLAKDISADTQIYELILAV